MDIVQRLIAKLKAAGLQVVRVSLGDRGDRTTWSVTLADGATDSQFQIAQNIVETFDLAEPTPVAVLTKYQFLGLLTSAERIQLRQTAKADPVLEDALAMMELAQEIRADDPLLAQMFGYCVGQGYITDERAAAIRAAMEVFV